MLEIILIFAKHMLNSKPDADLIRLANVLMRECERTDMPDWIEILANGNPDMLEAVFDAARADIRAEEAIK